MNKCARHDSNVRPFDSYAKGNSFVDWWVERGTRTYLFEAKAYQFSLPSRQTGERDVVVEREIKKVADAIKQVYKRIRDIPHYPDDHVHVNVYVHVDVVVNVIGFSSFGCGWAALSWSVNSV